VHTLVECRESLEAGRVTAEQLLDACLENVLAVGGEGERVFIDLQADRARRQAQAADARRAEGMVPSPWAGIPIAIKDLFDVAGQVTRAGSTLLADAAPALTTAPVIERLERAGLVIVGRTNMTEFAYSGVGLNPHYGTPRNPFDRVSGRVPGGSSSGAAISVTDGMAVAGIGTDTGGSCRIPAALTGLAGFKPTASRIPLQGVYPLSPSLDSVGSVGASVSCCAILDDLMAGGQGAVPDPVSLSGLRIAVLDHYVLEGMDDVVGTRWEAILSDLADGGARLSRIRLPDIETLPALNSRGGIAAAEAYAFHEKQLAQAGDDYDPRVADRIRAGAGVSSSDLAHLRSARQDMIGRFGKVMAGFDVFVAPTVPIIAPPLSAFEQDDEYVRLNLLLLRNPSLINFLDGCAISVPIHEPNTAPVGLMLAAPGGLDGTVLTVAAAVESHLSDPYR
jgi:aspartyl-tRNA(Asn)/glutamyl-tRNA(Gln) amidotransferase subunit A